MDHNTSKTAHFSKWAVCVYDQGFFKECWPRQFARAYKGPNLSSVDPETMTIVYCRTPKLRTVGSSGQAPSVLDARPYRDYANVRIGLVPTGHHFGVLTGRWKTFQE